MQTVKSILQALWAAAAAILRRPWGRRSLVVIALVLWLAGVPVIRLTYGAVVLPLRSAQYFLSIHRPDAQKLDKFTGFTNSHGPLRSYLERLALWSVLRSLRRERLALEKQAIALAIVRQESGFRFYVKNPSSTACGLFQLISASGAANDLPWWTCMDPLANSRAGSAFFREISANSTGDFSASLRCAYLKHYYGPSHSCAQDPQGIWMKTGRNLERWARTYLLALQQIQAGYARAGVLDRAWEALVQYLPLALLALILLGLHQLRRRPATR